MAGDDGVLAIAVDAMVSTRLEPVDALVGGDSDAVVVSHYVARAWNTSTWAHAALAASPELSPVQLLRGIFYQLQGDRPLAGFAESVMPMKVLRPLGNRWRKTLHEVVASEHDSATADAVVAAIADLPATFEPVTRAALLDDAASLSNWEQRSRSLIGRGG